MKRGVTPCRAHQYTAYRGLVCGVCGLEKMGTPSRYVSDFWACVQKTDTCWLWTGSVKHDGYGQASLTWPSRTPHRISFFLSNGYWPEAPNEVDHLCHNTLCVRPSHLREVAHVVNMNCRKNSGRCNAGHDLTQTRRFTPRRHPYCGACYDAARAEKVSCSLCGFRLYGRGKAKEGDAWVCRGKKACSRRLEKMVS